MPKDLRAVDQGAYFNVPDPRVPVLVTNSQPLNSWIKPVAGQPLTFRTVGVRRPNNITLKPFFDLHYNRYNVYWDVFSSADWQKREADYRAQEERRRAMDARRIDEMRVGEQQPEVDHNFQSEKSRSGEHGGRRWRDAEAGGYFAFDLKSLPDTAQELVVTYWGDDGGNRSFDILIDGQLLASQTLKHDQPGEFWDKTYPIPAELTKGKTKITVRFQAKPGQLAGGIFGASLLRR